MATEMKPDQEQSEDTFDFASLRRKLNLMLIRSASIEVDAKKTEEITFGDVLGNIAAFDYLILLLSLATALIVGFFVGLVLVQKLLDPTMVYLIFFAAVPGSMAGFLTWTLLFRLKRWLSW